MPVVFMSFEVLRLVACFLVVRYMISDFFRFLYSLILTANVCIYVIETILYNSMLHLVTETPPKLIVAMRNIQDR